MSLSSDCVALCRMWQTLQLNVNISHFRPEPTMVQNITANVPIPATQRRLQVKRQKSPVSLEVLPYVPPGRRHLDATARGLLGGRNHQETGGRRKKSMYNKAYFHVPSCPWSMFSLTFVLYLYSRRNSINCVSLTAVLCGFESPSSSGSDWSDPAVSPRVLQTLLCVARVIIPRHELK